MATPKKKHPKRAGRKTLYNLAILKKTQNYINSCVDEVEDYVKSDTVSGTGYQRVIKVNLPSLVGLALYLDISEDTVHEWNKIHPEFSEYTRKILAMQKKVLIDSGLSGDYNQKIAGLLLGQHGIHEKSEVGGIGGGAIKVEQHSIIENLLDEII